MILFLSILLYGFGLFVLINELFIKSVPDSHHVAGILITLILYTVKMVKRRRFLKEREERFELEYYDMIRDVFQYDDAKYASFMQGIDLVVLNKPRKALPVFEELQRAAGTIKEQYAVKFFLAECYYIMKQYEEEIALCQDMIRMDAERVEAWFQMGSSYIMLEQYKEAVRALEHVIPLVQGKRIEDNVYATLASAYVCVEKYIEAKKYIDKAYQLNPHKEIQSLKEQVEETLVYPVVKLEGIEVTPLFKYMVEMIGYPHRIFSEYTPQEELMRLYQEARQRGEGQGFVPVFLSDATYSMCEETSDAAGMPFDQYVKNRIDRLGPIGDGKEIADQRFRELTEPNEDYETYTLEELKGGMYGGEKKDYLEDAVCPPPICLFEVPAAHPWEVLLHVPGGAWEEYAAPEEMLAICKYWYEKYRALPASVSGDGVEFVLPEPVPEEDAFEVAKEIFSFCEDRVTVYTESGTLGELADSIRKSRVWSLWWT